MMWTMIYDSMRPEPPTWLTCWDTVLTFHITTCGPITDHLPFMRGKVSNIKNNYVSSTTTYYSVQSNKWVSGVTFIVKLLLQISNLYSKIPNQLLNLLICFCLGFTYWTCPTTTMTHIYTHCLVVLLNLL
jgi:hypothetical protein